MRDLEEMPSSRVRFLWPALTPAQRRKALAAGIAVPTDA